MMLGSFLFAGCGDKTDRAGEQIPTPRDDASAHAPIHDRVKSPAELDDARGAGSSDEIAASHILVAWTGVRDCPAGLQRTREQAEHRARRIAFLLRTDRGDLSTLARRYSDDPTAQRNGGYLGVFRRDEMMDALAELVSALSEGEIGGPVATPYGWHIVRREPVRKVRLHHLLIAYRDAMDADSRIERSRTDAARLAAGLRSRLSQPGVDLCALAATLSDDPENRHECGDLGWIEQGLLEPDVERAIFALKPGEVSPIVETVYGYHIFWRP